jgi:hypothetical protein
VSGAAVATTRPFITAFRTPRGDVVRLGAEGGERVTVRVQFEALWDAVAVDCRADEPVSTLVRTALGRFGLGQAPLSEFVVKLHGWEVKGTDTTVASAGAADGSTFLVHYRHRRPSR